MRDSSLFLGKTLVLNISVPNGLSECSLTFWKCFPSVEKGRKQEQLASSHPYLDHLSLYLQP